MWRRKPPEKMGNTAALSLVATVMLSSAAYTGFTPTYEFRGEKMAEEEGGGEDEGDRDRGSRVELMVHGSGFRFQDLGFKVQGLGFRV
jgi:hypothetical protein